ncbi:MAG: DUF4242 domain-containing protein [Dehalococcoidia bacterium]
MPLFLVERTFEDGLDLSSEDISRISGIKAELSVNWLYSFLSADKKKTYCIYEAPSVEAIHEASRRLGAPLGEVIEVSAMSLPTPSSSA